MDDANIFAATWCLVLALTLGLPSNGLLDHEIDRAIISPRGALLCPIVEDFYSYSRSTAYGPAQWGGISECCNGQRQSPRNLLSNSPSVCGRLSGPQLWYNSTRKIMGNLYNNGHDPTVHFHNSDTAYLFNAPYTVGPYLLDNVHLHFCTSTPRGSEHAINGKFYNGEIHLVHFKESYGSLGGAVLHDDGIVVIGIMVQAVEPYNNNLNSEMVELIRRMGELQGVGKGYQIPVYVDISKIFPRSRAFFTYSGSLTSPPCSEAVQWINFLEPINISPHEMEILRRLPNNENGFISDSCNDRPLQSGNTVVESNLACAFNTGNGEE